MMIVAHLKEDTGNQIQEKISTNEIKEQIITTAVSSGYINEPVSIPPDVISQCLKVNVPKKTVFDHLTECYSTQKNMNMLFSVQKSSNAVPIIDGLK